MWAQPGFISICPGGRNRRLIASHRRPFFIDNGEQNKYKTKGQLMIVRIASPNEGKNPTPNVRGLVLWIPGTVGNDKAGFDITVKTASSQTQLLQWLTIHGRNNSQVTVNCEQSDHQ